MREDAERRRLELEEKKFKEEGAISSQFPQKIKIFDQIVEVIRLKLLEEKLRMEQDEMFQKQEQNRKLKEEEDAAKVTSSRCICTWNFAENP